MADRPDATLRVLVVDDEPLVRQGLRLILDSEPDLVVVGEAGSGAEAVAWPARSSRTSSAWTYGCPTWTGSGPPSSCCGCRTRPRCWS